MRSTCRCTTSAFSACRAATTRYSNSIDFIPPSVHTRTSGSRSRRCSSRAAQMVFLFNLSGRLPTASDAGRQSVARHDARMADARHAAQARQLGQGPAGRAIAGRTTTACPARRRTSSRRTCRPAIRSRGPRARSRDHGVHHEPDGRLRALLTGVIVWLILVRKLTREAMGSAAAPPRHVADRSEPHRAGETRPVGVPRGHHFAVRSVHLRVLHAHERHTARARRMTGVPLTEPPVLWLNTVLLILGSVAMQVARACAPATSSAGGNVGCWSRRPAARSHSSSASSTRGSSCASPAVLLAAESGGRILLRADRRARPAPARRPVRLGPNRRAHARHGCRADRRAPERGALHASTGTSCCWSGWSCSPCCCPPECESSCDSS